MNGTTWLLIAVAVVIVLIVAFVVMRRRNTQRLKSKFGPEYSRAVDASGNQQKAEAELQDREKRVKGFELKPLEPRVKTEFQNAWRSVQTQFVDDPGRAVTQADKLLGEVMSLRGYPMADFEQRSADISVEHPVVVENYRKAHEIADRHAQGMAGTEELRQAMVFYRTLFMELVGETPPDAVGDAQPDVVRETQPEAVVETQPVAEPTTPSDVPEEPQPRAAQGR